MHICSGPLAVALCHELEERGLTFTITLVDPFPAKAMKAGKPFGNRSALQHRARFFDMMLKSNLEKKVEENTILDSWHLDLEMLRCCPSVQGNVRRLEASSKQDQFGDMLDTKMGAANMLRMAHLVYEAVEREQNELVRGHDFKILATHATIFVADAGLAWFRKQFSSEYDFDEVVLQDERYGWESCFAFPIHRIDATGGHLDFFAHETNVVMLAKHLRSIIGHESDTCKAKRETYLNDTAPFDSIST